MIRDILNLRSGDNIVYEYLNENRMVVTGEGAYTDDETFLSYNTGPTFKVGRVSSFRGLDKRIKAISRASRHGSLDRHVMELEDV